MNKEFDSALVTPNAKATPLFDRMNSDFMSIGDERRKLIEGIRDKLMLLAPIGSLPSRQPREATKDDPDGSFRYAMKVVYQNARDDNEDLKFIFNWLSELV